MAKAGFMRWINEDETADVICLCCFETIAQARSLDELLVAEDHHSCKAWEDFLLPQPDPYAGIYG
jgi:hypothetical protein